MTVIVTGGMGFIGSNLVKALNGQGIDDIYIVDTPRNGSEKNIEGCNYTDIIDIKDALNSIKKVGQLESIFHQGAISDTTFPDRKKIIKNNFIFSADLYKFCCDIGADLIYASSASVYGLGSSGFEEREECENPLNYYAESKLMFDHYIRSKKAKNTQTVGLRYFNVYGQNENHKLTMASPVNQFCNQSIIDGKIKVFKGSENYRRDFISVKDIVDINMFFFFNKGIDGIYNCGTGLSHSFMDVAKIISKAIGGTIEEIPFPEKLKEKYQSYTRANIEKLRKVGYNRPFRVFEEEVRGYALEVSAG